MAIDDKVRCCETGKILFPKHPIVVAESAGTCLESPVSEELAKKALNKTSPLSRFLSAFSQGGASYSLLVPEFGELSYYKNLVTYHLPEKVFKKFFPRTHRDFNFMRTHNRHQIDTYFRRHYGTL